MIDIILIIVKYLVFGFAMPLITMAWPLCMLAMIYRLISFIFGFYKIEYFRSEEWIIELRVFLFASLVSIVFMYLLLSGTIDWNEINGIVDI